MPGEAVSFPWSWHPHVEVWILVAALLGAYFWALRVLGPKHVEPIEFAATRRQKIFFVLGCGAILAAADWPMHELSENYLYSAHMIQHMTLTFAAAPLLMLGTPAWLWRVLLSHPKVLAAVRAITRPLIALIVFNVVLVFTHWPLIVTASVRTEGVHLSLHLLLFASALIMWTPVLSPLLELPRLTDPGRMLFLFLQSLVPTIPASFLTFGAKPLYHVYETFPRLWGISAHTDQLVAGLIMKIVGGFILWGVIAVIWFRWWSLENKEGVDVLAFGDVDRALNRAQVAKS
ncbi:MAG: cytochrome c oxidase assembly protein [Actinomycetota bacterium]